MDDVEGRTKSVTEELKAEPAAFDEVLAIVETVDVIC